MRAWLVVVAVAACKYNAPDPGATGDTSRDGAPVDEAVLDPIDAPPGAWMHPYLHRKRITLLATQVDDTDGNLPNFPALIALDADPDLAAATQMPDMAFTASDATTLLDSEIELYTNGSLLAWVRIPTLAATENTVIYVYYSNPTPPSTNPENVWMQDFFGVWHFTQDPAGANILDSTASNRDGTASGMAAGARVTAKVGPGYNFDGSNDFIDFPTAANVGNNFTISMWVNLDAGSNAGIKTLFSNTIVGSNQDGFRFFVNTSGTSNRRVHFETGDGAGSNTAETGDNAVTAGTFAHVAAVIDRNGGSGTIYIDGVERQNDAGILNGFATNRAYEIARMGNGVQFAGLLDEVNVATVRRNVGWIKTTFNNQSAPLAFITLDGEEDVP